MGGLCSLDRCSVGSRPRLHDLDLSSLSRFFSRFSFASEVNITKPVSFLQRFGCRIVISIGFRSLFLHAHH